MYSWDSRSLLFSFVLNPLSILSIFPHFGSAFRSKESLKALYNNSRGRMKIYGELSPEFTTYIGDRQGCPLSPFRFNFAIDMILELSLSKSVTCGIELLPGSGVVSQESLSRSAGNQYGNNSRRLDWSAMDVFARCGERKLQVIGTRFHLNPSDCLICVVRYHRIVFRTTKWMLWPVR